MTRPRRRRGLPSGPPLWMARSSAYSPTTSPHSEDLLRRIAAIIGERYDIAGVVEHNKGGWQWPARIEDLQRTASSIDVAIHATAE